MKRNQKTSHLLMILLLLIWTADAVTVSAAVSAMPEIFLLCFKTLCSIPVLTLFVRFREGLRLPKRGTIPSLVLAALLGDVFYFFFEYSAYRYLPIGQVTVLLGIMPVFSYLTDCLIRRSRPRLSILAASADSAAGLALIVWDSRAGSLLGYVCCAVCVALWIAYGYAARRLDRDYSPEAITLYESVIAAVCMLPFALAARPAVISARDLWLSIVGMGALTAGVGYIIEVRGLIDLGTTVSGIYLNFLPVLTAAAGFLFLHQTMTARQMIGGLIVIACGVFVVLTDK